MSLSLRFERLHSEGTTIATVRQHTAKCLSSCCVNVEESFD